ncbi:NAD(P)-dependent dehydrogenase (short-subunit alcohol dehydrogenase family) [Novosphingobium sp. PhB165]|uniref:SDR family NAD(P)-dependent oxidoreductase n=1 Tax=Novosphingobium sp. PhB165 TaxID=2485105 RepID=UPI00104E43A0|nr:SDR family oxidoreductase [Novosphingobium sp. PhB165]TCM20713.1 NAD(P)-dependent dehydrogenase (short-subunit alcohol dehydrogenase family) [Novosphingobium sp. PhB165]
MRLNDKVALVTGAGSGIGRAICELFAAEGARVVCADISGAQVDVAAAIGKAAYPVHADVTQSRDVAAMVAAAQERYGRLDILVNNAGITGAIDAPLHEQDEDAFDLVVNVNLRSVFLGMKHAIPAMLRTGGGAIVNTASASGLVGWKGLSCYSASKAAVIQLTKSAALDYAKDRIRINAICPGTTWTGMVPWSEGLREPPEGTAVLPNIPMERWGLDREIASAAVYLVSDEASYVTGIAMPVDGGYVAA